ncbi:1-deoxy-D-xylulose-5-phosphate synthase [Candidatus Woesearchaeota archaeon]|nr:1-deoxy-D-xylulose-5-phosphate synthase [Candidatus Woesearchaeota archaeon]
MEQPTTHFLDMIEGPKDIKVLSMEQLRLLAKEIRAKILGTVAKNGGHLASPLGAVELTLALHYVFNAPADKIIFDVGNQGYAHKLITGRAKRFHSLRQYKGISGFLKREESEYDVFNAGHSSTSIGAGLGIAKARDLLRQRYKVISVIGDGAMTAGMAFEALNQAGDLKTDLIVILNDNSFSISPNVGALKHYLNKLVTHPGYKAKRQKILSFLSHFGANAAKKAAKIEESLHAISGPGLLFRELGFRYFGPIDGHNIEKMIRLFNNIKDMRVPILMHVRTQKGRGFNLAENNAEKYHGAKPFDLATGEAFKPSVHQHMTYTEAFSNALVKLAKDDARIVAITAAMAPGTGLDKFQKEFPERFFDVGIAEQHAVTFAGGLAVGGLKPVVAIYSTFLQRAYDQIIHDVCLMNLPVVFAIDRAGLVGEDGATHHGVFDISYLRAIPNLTIMSPANENEVGKMLATALDNDGPVALRYPRSTGMGVGVENPLEPVAVAKAEVLREGKDVLIIGFGPIVNTALEAAIELAEKKISCCIVNARFAKPLDEETLISLAKKCKKVLTVEENSVKGGFGSAVLELLRENNLNIPVTMLGIPDKFVDHGSQKELYKMIGLDKGGIVKMAESLAKKSYKILSAQ